MKVSGISWAWLVVAAFVGAVLTFLLLGRSTAQAKPLLSPDAGTEKAKVQQCGYSITRVSGFHRVHPVLFTEPMCESPRFEGLRNDIGSLIDRLKAAGTIASASVYVRDFAKAEWTWYNGDEQYDPGSMLKVSVLLAWLSVVDEDPSMLQRAWICTEKEAATEQNTAFPSAQAQAGHSYTTAQLLELMIVNSDNRATAILFHHIDPDRYLKTYGDLGLPVPNRSTKSYRMNVRDYSVFMKALYNSSYLSPLRSEYALELMTRSEFRKGLVAGIPEGTDIAHKFGEAGDPVEKQLHETGLVYRDGYPYLITVMTRGQQVDSLAGAISAISRLVYDGMRPD